MGALGCDERLLVRAKMANGRAEVVANTGHLVFLEAPARYSELVLGFLAVAP